MPAKIHVFGNRAEESGKASRRIPKRAAYCQARSHCHAKGAGLPVDYRNRVEKRIELHAAVEQLPGFSGVLCERRYFHPLIPVQQIAQCTQCACEQGCVVVEQQDQRARTRKKSATTREFALPCKASCAGVRFPLVAIDPTWASAAENPGQHPVKPALCILRLHPDFLQCALLLDSTASRRQDFHYRLQQAFRIVFEAGGVARQEFIRNEGHPARIIEMLQCPTERFYGVPQQFLHYA